MARGAFQVVVATSLLIVAAFSEAREVFKEAQRSRLAKSVITRLPNVASYSPSRAIDSHNLHTLIGEVLCEFKTVLLSEHCLKFPDAVPVDVSQKAAIKEEVRTAPNSLTDLVTAE